MHRRRALVPPLLLAVVAVLAAGGCSGGGGTQAPAAGATTAPTATTLPEGPGAQPSATGEPPATAAPETTTAPTTAPARLDYRFPVAGCRVQYGRGHHDYPAADMFTGRGCAFVAPVAGRVDEVTLGDRWSPGSDRGADRGGRSVSLVGADGVRYYGSHLEAVAPGVAPGVRVAAGQLLGRIGDSGSARGTGPHLHFGISWPTGPGIWWVRRGMVPPAPYLDAWRAGQDRSPAAAVRAARRAAGAEVPACQARC
jgi:murein DD-endopeptidase MepM/ murein hydrolase activator NlpD